MELYQHNPSVMLDVQLHQLAAELLAESCVGGKTNAVEFIDGCWQLAGCDVVSICSSSASWMNTYWG